MSFLIPGWQRARYPDALAVGGFLYGPEEETDMGKKIDIVALKPVVGTLYPQPFDVPCRLRERTRLGDAAGLTQYGVNLMRLPPGAWSSQRHWHAKEDEFIYVLSGEVVLATDAGEELLHAGDCAGFKAGDPDGHCLQNRGTADATVLEIGPRITKASHQVTPSVAMQRGAAE